MLKYKNLTNNVVGNSKSISQFLKALEQSQNNSSWILKGPKGIGKAKVVSLLTSEILKLKKGFINDISRAAHPDLIYVKKDDDKKYIPVEKTRSIINFFNKTAFHSNGKIAIIDSISELNHHGLNSLLKVLEELQKKNCIFLIDHQSRSIPSTITSRCKVFLMNSLNTQDTINVLKNLAITDNEKDLEFVSDLSAGRPGTGLKLLKKKVSILYVNICKSLLAIEEEYDKNIIEIYKAINKDIKKENLEIFINLLKYLFKKMLYTKYEMKVSYFFLEEKNVLKKLDNKLTIKKILLILSQLKKKLNEFNIYSLGIENVLMSILIEINNIITNDKND